MTLNGKYYGIVFVLTLKNYYFDIPFPKVLTSTSSLPDEQKLKPVNPKSFCYL